MPTMAVVAADRFNSPCPASWPRLGGEAMTVEQGAAEAAAAPLLVLLLAVLVLVPGMFSSS
jgi:hypothetical protein